MRTLSNTKAELKKGVAYKKRRALCLYLFCSACFFFPFFIANYQVLCIIGSYFFSSAFIFLILLINLLISREPFLSVSAKKPKIADCGVNSGRSKSVEKNILS